MKNLKRLLLASVFLIGLNSFAQNTETTEVLKATITKKYHIEKNGKLIPYTLKIYENRMNNITLDESEKHQVNQTRKLTPAYVSKLVYIDSDKDNSYDMYMVIRYKKSLNDSFEVVATEKGFAVDVDERHMEYILGEGVYYVNNSDRDYFIVEEFSAF